MIEVKESDRKENEAMLREMCEVIEKSWVLENKEGINPSAEEVYNHSLVPMIHLYYALALDKLGIAKLEIKKL